MTERLRAEHVLLRPHDDTSGRVTCAVCGAAQEYRLPTGGATFVALIEQFIAAHLECAEAP
jgi:hypothetical protein